MPLAFMPTKFCSAIARYKAFNQGQKIDAVKEVAQGTLGAPGQHGWVAQYIRCTVTSLKATDYAY